MSSPEMLERIYTVEELLRPVDLGTPVDVQRIYRYVTSYEAARLPWYKNVSVLSHIANAALFSAKIAEEARSNGTDVDVHKVWQMGWLRDIGRVPWGIAASQKITEITENYGHHGYLGYVFLQKCGVPEDLAVISMTHIGSGLTAEETHVINEVLGKGVFPERDWYAKTLEEMIVVIGDKVPGWNNTIVAHYEANLRGETKGNKIQSWLEDQTPLWERFWNFKQQVDEACGCDALSLFDSGLLVSDEEIYARLPHPEQVARMPY